MGWRGTTSTQIHSLDLKLILRDLNWVKVMLQTAKKNERARKVLKKQVKKAYV